MSNENVIKFKRDTTFRNDMFTPESFAHPAKLDSQLLLWIVERYTKPGETILDPMFGSGTAMLACTLGRNVIGVELEEKFCKMAAANWEKVRQRPQLGFTMGTCWIIHGDARNLSGLLADKIITSPPYADALQGKVSDGLKDAQRLEELTKANPDRKWKRKTELTPGRMRAWGVMGTEYSPDKDNIGSLPYGTIDHILTSPPSEATFNEKQHTLSGIAKRDPNMRKEVGGYSGKVDHIVTSPPYEASVSQGEGPGATTINKGRDSSSFSNYGETKDNIGNLKSTSYLAAMKTVYGECLKVLKPGGLMILITKNFIREQKEIRLDLDTIRLCEQSGFTFKERWYRELPAQSFWRIIYKQRFPDAPELKFEDVFVFSKESDEFIYDDALPKNP